MYFINRYSHLHKQLAKNEKSLIFLLKCPSQSLVPKYISERYNQVTINNKLLRKKIIFSISKKIGTIN